ncbi:MAG: hypothetical protein ABI609_18240 [Acidobacteriota bacterium]
MNELCCDRESATLAAARSGEWSEGLREHARLCPDCAAALAVHEVVLDRAAHLRSLSAGRSALPSADSLLWRARFQSRIERAERVARPIVLLDRLAIGVAAAVAVLGLAWKGSAITAWIGNGVSRGASPELASFLVITLAFAGAVAWIYTAWAED